MKHFANIEDYLVRALRRESARPYRVRAFIRTWVIIKNSFDQVLLIRQMAKTVVVNDKFEIVNLKKTDIYNNW